MHLVLVIAILSLLLWTLLPQANRPVVEDLFLEETAPAPSRTHKLGR
jgi:hypothetical protein